MAIDWTGRRSKFASGRHATNSRLKPRRASALLIAPIGHFGFCGKGIPASAGRLWMTTTEPVSTPAATPASGTPNRWLLFWRTVTRFDRKKIIPWIALRNTIGVALPLTIGILTGATLSGVAIAVGALNVSYSDGDDSYQRRARRMLLAGILTSAAVFMGGILGRNYPTAILIAALWAFASGLVVSLGTTAADLGVISLVTLIVYSAQGLSSQNAAWAGLLALSGSLFQTALSLLFWPVRRYQ